MGKDKKRKSRRELSKKLDVSKAITLDMLGTKDDPCFGKFYDPRAAECNRCGDSELCAIAMGQLNHLKRDKTEKSFNFEDIEELKINPKKKSELLKDFKKELTLTIKDHTRGIKLDKLILIMYAMFMNESGFTKEFIKKRIIRIRKKSKNVYKDSNNLYKWKT